MGRAKDLVIKPISAADAKKIVKKYHYSKGVVPNSQLHFGVFLNGRCGGALQYGPSMDKRKTIGLVEGTEWNGFLELNRMALADWLPRNGETRAIGITCKMIRRQYPHVKWIISFSDAVSCGDGTIYRGSGFLLTGMRENNQIWARLDDDGNIVERSTRLSLTTGKNCVNGGASMQHWKDVGWVPLPGYQLRYIKFLDPTWRARLNVPVIPFEKIDEVGAGMYRGQRRSLGRDENDEGSTIEGS